MMFVWEVMRPFAGVSSRAVSGCKAVVPWHKPDELSMLRMLWVLGLLVFWA